MTASVHFNISSCPVNGGNDYYFVQSDKADSRVVGRRSYGLARYTSRKHQRLIKQRDELILDLRRGSLFPDFYYKLRNKRLDFTLTYDAIT